MILQIDVDGILADFMKGASKLAHDIDPSIPLVDTLHTKDWDNWEGWSEEVKKEVWGIIKDPSSLFFYTLSSLLNRDDWWALRRLHTMENQLYFVTSRPGKTAKHQTEGWLYDHLEKQATVIITPNKAGFAQLIKPDWSIEDNGTNAAKIAQILGVERSFLLDRPYNVLYHPRSSTRIHHFREFITMVNGGTV